VTRFCASSASFLCSGGNGREWVPHDQLDTALQDGDNVILKVMVAGG
jgi:molybdopterin converting factor small subunit